MALIPFLIRLFGILVSSLLGSLEILEISPLSAMGVVKIFSHSIDCCFVLLAVPFVLEKALSVKRSHLFLVALRVYATTVLFRE